MGRKVKMYTLISVENGKLAARSGHDAEELKAEIAKLDDGADVMVFEGGEVPYSISRTPTVQLGGKRDRAPRTKKAAKAPPAKEAKGSKVSSEFFEKPANGAAPTTTTGQE